MEDTAINPLESATTIVDEIQSQMEKMPFEECSSFIACVLSGIAVHLINGDIKNFAPTLSLYNESVETAKVVTIFTNGKVVGEA